MSPGVGVPLDGSNGKLLLSSRKKKVILPIIVRQCTKVLGNSNENAKVFYNVLYSRSNCRKINACRLLFVK